MFISWINYLTCSAKNKNCVKHVHLKTIWESIILLGKYSKKGISLSYTVKCKKGEMYANFSFFSLYLLFIYICLFLLFILGKLKDFMMGCENHTLQQWLHSFGTLLFFPNKSDFLSLYSCFYYNYNRKYNDDYHIHRNQDSILQCISCSVSLLYGYLAYQQHCSQMITPNFLVRQQNDFICSLWLQIFLSLTLLGGECLLLAAMSDRYVAICHLLRYPILMNDYVSVLMVGKGPEVYWDNQLHSSHSLCTSLSLFVAQEPLIIFWNPHHVGVVLCGHNTLWTRSYVSGIIFLLVPFSPNLLHLMSRILHLLSSTWNPKEARKSHFLPASSTWLWS